MTSGIDGIYPKGFVVGTHRVELERVGRDVSQTIRVRPAVDFSTLEEVLVVLRQAGAGGGPARPRLQPDAQPRPGVRAP